MRSARPPEAGESAGVALILAAATLWGVIGPVATVAGAAGVLPLELAFWRALLAGGAFAIIAARRPASVPTRSDAAGMAGFGFIGIAVMYSAFFAAVEHSGAGLAAVLLYTGPSWVAVFERFRTGSALGGPRVLALGLTLAGVALIALGGGEAARVSRLGLAAGLLSGLAFAAHFTLAVPYLRRYGTPTVFAIALLSGAMILAPSAPAVPSSGTAWSAIVFIALVSTVGASICFGAAVVRLNPVRTAVLATLEPVVAAVAGVIISGVAPAPSQGVGMALVVLGAAAVAGTRERQTSEI